MAAPTIPGFDYTRVPVADSVDLNVAHAGSGSPVVLLHGFPQTHLMWRHVAPALARDHTVLCPDLRGYGASARPPATTPHSYAKRTMGEDVVALAEHFGFDRFALVGHDRGALVTIRAGLDHPDRITHLAALDVLPTPDMWEVLHGHTAAVAFHLYLMAQPPGLPERMIRAAADEFFGYFLDTWCRHPGAIPDEVRAEYLRASAAAVDSIVADYRASATIDLEHDRADRAAGRRLTMPVTVIQQDWGAELGYDATAIWQRWADDLDHRTLALGHFMAEEAPDAVVDVLTELLRR
ncbi:alpha/beta fold hydrolase [Nocardia veterana]|uniref:Alpha/beta hydrolase n=1 Tax=Nocardia veterana TaxID=132249 RepID=A0A7X6LWD5_9NOCA|nr:alpha/beta hydrolase [Nocardia veterana]NKY85122.1 alpha/beta hydrolase [Nocardia veterana]